MPSPDSNPERAKAKPSADKNKVSFLSLAIVSARQPKLTLGQIVITSNAHSVLTTDDVTIALRRHAFGDWGTVCAEDWKTNNQRCREKGMVLSAYESAKGTPFWVISDPGHEVTTVLLPEDY
jgi:hypothetical protein